jgi:NAD(P)-dependent dehydrogenase (short-subunit alcohol dehydrogenase family)
MKLINKFSLFGKVVIITGGAGFLGKQFATIIADANGTPVLLDINYKKALSICISIKKIFGINALAIKCDITNENQVKKALKIIKDKFADKKVFGLINNAAFNPQPKKNLSHNKNQLEKFSNKTWNDEINVSLTGAFICTKVFGTYFSEKRQGSIINISSDLGLKAPKQSIYKHLNYVKPVTYSVIKHGIIGLTKYICSYWGKEGVRCNTIAPGGVYNNQDKVFVRKICKEIPAGKMAKISDFDGIIIYLLSDLSEYVNGSLISIDGGRAIY